MLSGKYILFEQIMARIFDLGIPPQEIEEEEVVEMIYDIVDAIAAPNLFFDMTAELTVENFGADLPCDFYKLYDGGVRHIPSGTHLVYSPDIYFYSPNTRVPAILEVDQYAVPDGIIQGITREGLNYSGYSGGSASGAPVFADSNGINGYPTYKLENNRIYTGFQTGTVEIAYQAFPTDDRGKPMVPDNIRIINCVVYGVARRIALRMVMKDRLAEKKYEILNQEALWYMASAQNAARIPNQDKMEVLANIWQDPFRDGGHHMAGFNRLANRPRVMTHNTKRYR